MSTTIIGRYINGNYTTTILSDGTKIRETNDDEFVPKFAENCDVKITDRCDGNCGMCYEGCTQNGKHADILNAKWIDSLHPFTELALNGNDLTHPQLVEFLEILKSNKVIANLTVNQIHFEKYFDFLKHLTDNRLIWGLGISLRHPTKSFIEKIQQFPNAVIHTINGILTKEDVQTLSNNNIKMLVLGYKQLERGIEYYNNNFTEIESNQKWLYDELPEMLDKFKCVSFDNLAIEQLNVKRLMTEKEWDEFYMGDDGGFTFYIDMVEGTFGKNSLTPKNKRYEIGNKTIDEMFVIVRSR